MPFFIIFLIIPLIEVGLFVTIGNKIGLSTTLLLCVVTAAIGAIILRYQGTHTLFSARKSIEEGTTPFKEMFDGLCLAIAAVLLMTPGFFTDFLGFSLLVPPARGLLWALIQRHFSIEAMPGAHQNKQTHYDVIDIEYEHIDENKDEK